MSQLDTVIERDVAPPAGAVDMKLEVVVISVSDVDRAKRFYGGLDWRLDANFFVGDTSRGVQFTPPGSPASIHFGKGVTTAPPGSARGLFLVVSETSLTWRSRAKRGSLRSLVQQRV